MTTTHDLAHRDHCTSGWNLRLGISKTGRRLLTCPSCGASTPLPDSEQKDTTALHAFATGRPVAVVTSHGLVVCHTLAEYDAAKAGVR